jgi:mitochondrial chaperone BCS1
MRKALARPCRFFTASTHEGDGHDASEQDADKDNGKKDDEKRGKLINEREYVTDFFIYRGKLILFEESKSDNENNVLDFFCLDKSTKVLEDWLEEVNKSAQQKGKVRIFTYSGGTSWTLLKSKIQRAVENVWMEDSLRADILSEITAYYEEDEAVARSLGIPWRKGYPFHGKPGTGKTTLAYALAGHFGMRVHVLSLTHPNLDDEMLLKLGEALGEKDLLLLEDIDCVGLSWQRTAPILNSRSKHDIRSVQLSMRSHYPEKSSNTQRRQHAHQRRIAQLSHKPGDRGAYCRWQRDHLLDEDAEEGSGYDEGNWQEEEEEQEEEPSQSPNRVTLAGLLNMLDSGRAPEGHIVVMTTNHKDVLDDALIRHGRVSRQIEFKYITKSIAKQMFTKMYDVETRKTVNYIGAQIPFLAEDFARNCPEGVLSPAAIQDFIFARKQNPKRAVDEIKQWAEAEERAEIEKRGDALQDETVVAPVNESWSESQIQIRRNSY